MTKLPILTFPNPILRKKANTVAKVDAKIKKLIADMIETMLEAPGVGLAAPQVGQSVQVIVIDIRNPITIKDKKGEKTVGGESPEHLTLGLVNPRIVKRSGKQTFTEGCLCLPGVEAPVERAHHVLVKALNVNGEPIEITAEDLTATILQHEIDHLDGKVFIDRVKDKETIEYRLPEEIPVTEKE
jgi:peptide deformylase